MRLISQRKIWPMWFLIFYTVSRSLYCVDSLKIGIWKIYIWMFVIIRVHNFITIFFSIFYAFFLWCRTLLWLSWCTVSLYFNSIYDCGVTASRNSGRTYIIWLIISQAVTIICDLFVLSSSYIVWVIRVFSHCSGSNLKIISMSWGTSFPIRIS